MHTDRSQSPKIWNPPKGYIQVPVTKSSSKMFDIDSIKDSPNIELWAFRIPPTLKAKYLDGFTFELPPTTSSGVAPLIGNITNTHNSFNIHLLPRTTFTVDDPSLTPAPGGEEVRDLECLLPQRRMSNKLFAAPKPISRHFVITQSHPDPRTPNDQSFADLLAHRPQPLSRLKHTYIPVGALGSLESSESDFSGQVMEIDIPQPPTQKAHPNESKFSKSGKKRRHTVMGETVVPKSPKRLKKSSQ